MNKDNFSIDYCNIQLQQNTMLKIPRGSQTFSVEMAIHLLTRACVHTGSDA